MSRPLPDGLRTALSSTWELRAWSGSNPSPWSVMRTTIVPRPNAAWNEIRFRGSARFPWLWAFRSASCVAVSTRHRTSGAKPREWTCFMNRLRAFPMAGTVEGRSSLNVKTKPVSSRSALAALESEEVPRTFSFLSRRKVADNITYRNRQIRLEEKIRIRELPIC